MGQRSVAIYLPKAIDFMDFDWAKNSRLACGQISTVKQWFDQIRCESVVVATLCLQCGCATNIEQLLNNFMCLLK